MKAGLAESLEISAAVRACEEELAGEGRVLIRPSGTEPLIRVMVEGPSQEQITDIAHRIVKAIQETLSWCGRQRAGGTLGCWMPATGRSWSGGGRWPSSAPTPRWFGTPPAPSGGGRRMPTTTAPKRGAAAGRSGGLSRSFGPSAMGTACALRLAPPGLSTPGFFRNRR